MAESFFERPILNSPYEVPKLHHALDDDGQPLDIPPAEGRRRTIETEGQMLQRACSELLGLKNVVVINDEAHHCYRHKELEVNTVGKKGRLGEHVRHLSPRRQ